MATSQPSARRVTARRLALVVAVVASLAAAVAGLPSPSADAHIITVAADWLDATLYGNAAARRQFVGTGCGLCSGTPWVMQSKNW